jgi:capsular polysaccharide biosynthesis protein
VEISDYLNLVRKRIRLFLLVPVLAAALVVVAMLLTTDERYVTNATVTVSSLGGAAGSQFTGAQGNRMLLETFGAAAATPTVLQKVSEKTSVPLATLQQPGSITVAPIGESSLVRVTTRMPEKEKSAEVARWVAAESIKFLLEPQVNLAGQLAEQSQKTVAETEGQLSELGKSSGLALGIPDYEMKSRAVSALREEQLRARSLGNTSLASSLQGPIDAQSAELAALAPKMAQFQTLSELNKQALARVNAARATEEQAKALQASAEAGDLITLGEPQRVPIGPMILRRALGGLGAGVFIAALIVILLEFLARSAPVRKPVPEKAPLGEEPEPEPS